MAGAIKAGDIVLDVNFSKIRALVTYSKTAVEQEPGIGKWDSQMRVEASRAVL